MPQCLIGLGSNLGDRGALLSAARDQLAKVPQSSLTAISEFLESQPAGGPAAQPPFLNAAALLDSSLSPHQLLSELQRIENELGRARIERWGPRTLDLDLLLYDRLELESCELTLPHPRMSFRRFVLEPAAEIAAEMVYPINGWTINKLLNHSRDSDRSIGLADVADGNESAGTNLLRALASHPQVVAVSDRFSASNDVGQRTIRQEVIENQWVVFDNWTPEFLADPANLPCDSLKKGTPRLIVAWHPTKRELPELDRVRRSCLCPPCLWIPGMPLAPATQEVIAAMAAME